MNIFRGEIRKAFDTEQGINDRTTVVTVGSWCHMFVIGDALIL